MGLKREGPPAGAAFELAGAHAPDSSDKVPSPARFIHSGDLAPVLAQAIRGAEVLSDESADVSGHSPAG
jgi:hypothetical protein